MDILLDRKWLLLLTHPDKKRKVPPVVWAGVPFKTASGRRSPLHALGEHSIDNENVMVLAKSGMPSGCCDDSGCVSLASLFSWAVKRRAPPAPGSKPRRDKVVRRRVTVAEIQNANDTIPVTWHRQGPEEVCRHLDINWDLGLPQTTRYTGLGHNGGDLVVNFESADVSVICPQKIDPTTYYAAVSIRNTSHMLLVIVPGTLPLPFTIPDVGHVYRHTMDGHCIVIEGVN